MVVLTCLLGRREQAVRERLRDGYRKAPARLGARLGAMLRSLETPTCFAPVLRRVVTLHPRDCHTLALADVAWYRLRSWIEARSRNMKRSGWH